jgi:peroxiredoxin
LGKAALAAPLDGPATLESGLFIELPGSRLVSGKSWEVVEDGRPARAWQVVGSEVVNGTACVKLVGVQQTDDWDEPRADCGGWRRTDVAWLVPGTGLLSRIERTIERREPARRNPTERSVTRYDLESRIIYPGQLLEDRRREITQFRSLADALEPFLREPERNSVHALDAFQAKLTHHMENAPATPYREALVHLRRRIDAARRGETPAAEVTENAAPVANVAALGHHAPDFVVPNLVTHESTRLRRLLGKPVLLIFFNPVSRTASEVLHFAQEVNDAVGAEARVVALAVSEDDRAALQERDRWKLTIPMLAGNGLRVTFGLDTTPKLVVLDAAGVVRGSYVGWGKETPDLVAEELARWRRPAAGTARTVPER